MNHATSLLRRLLPLAVGILLAGPVAAKTVDTLADPALAMTVDGRAYPARIIDMMLAAAQQARREATWEQMLDSVAENQLMAAHAVRELGRERLLPVDKVGFTPQALLEEQFNALIKMHYFRQIDGYVKSRPGGNLDGLIVRELPPDDPAVRELTTLRDIGEVRLTPEQRQLAARTVMAEVRFPDGGGNNITFDDVYTRMNVQGRVRVLQDRDLRFLGNQVRTRVEGLFVSWWAATQSGLSSAEIATLRTMLEEKMLRENYVMAMGVVSTLHEDTTPNLERLQKAVTRAEIRAWYTKNRDQFRQVEKVRARHIRCATEAACQQALDAVNGGMEFSAAARKFSIADDRLATPAGNLGWIARAQQELPWLHQIALIQQQGQVTPPIRSPEDAAGNAVWEVVRVDERIEGYSPVDSETVAYQARQEIAKKKAVQQYKARRDALLAAADIRRNGKLLAARREAEAKAPPVPRPATPAADPHGHGHGHRH